MTFVDVRSSNIASIAYEDLESKLGVRFKNGAEYHYMKVPRKLFDQMLKAPSVGQFLDREIKKRGFRCVEIR